MMVKVIAIVAGVVLGLFGLAVVGIVWWFCWVIKA